MSSLFNKTVNNIQNSSHSCNLASSRALKAQNSKCSLSYPNALNENNIFSLSALNLPAKQFSDKLKIQQHNYALNTNNYLKTIDNSLEEASRTGELFLSNKSLIDFPSSIAMRYDLTDTLTVDLSKNRLHQLPKDLLRFKPLENISISSNAIQTIPEIGINQLRCLKILDLNCNRLTYLPPSLCQLVSLEILTINNNKLVSLPEEIGRLEKLLQLDVSCNEITHLPIQIGDMVSLRSLNIRRNLLVELPREISKLKLVSFDCSSNRINKLPLCFRKMVTLIDLTLDNNPLELPPAYICTKGLLYVMKYLLVEAIKEEKKRGVLSEYEINNQMNLLSMNNRSEYKAEKCVTGLNIKKYHVENVLAQSPAASSSTSTASSSNSISSSSLKNAKHKVLPDKQNQNITNSRNRSGNFATQLSQTNLTTMDSYQFDHISKQSHFFTENIDSIDPSMSLTSTPSSTTSSSPTTTTTNTGQNIITTNNKVFPIHDLISPNKYVLMSNNNSKNYKINSNQYNEFIIDNEDSHNQKIWRSNDESLAHKNNPNTTIYNNLCRPPSDSFKKSVKISSDAKAYTNHISKHSFHDSHFVLNDPNPQFTNSKPQIVYDEFLNPIMVGPLANSSEMTADLTSSVNDSCLNKTKKNKYFLYEEQQKQMIWIPRDDIILTETPHFQSINNAVYNANQHKPQYAPVISQNQASTLSYNNYKEPSMNELISSPFTFRGQIIQTEEESQQIEALKKIIESNLKIYMPVSSEEICHQLSDGVILCQLINRLYPQTILSIHLPDTNMSKLSISKCRKNIESFIESCQRLGINKAEMCSVQDILEAKNIALLSHTVIMVANFAQYCQQNIQNKSQKEYNCPLQPSINECASLQQQSAV